MGSDPSEEELKALLRRVNSDITTNLAEKDVRLLADSLVPSSTRSARSLAFLCLSKYCEAVGKENESEEKTTETINSTFTSFVDEAFSKHDEVEPETFIPFTSLITALVPLAPLAAVQLLTTPIKSPSDPPSDALVGLLEAAELPSTLQPALAELLAQAAGTKPGRELVRSRALEWLRGAVSYGEDTELGVLCAVALSKLGKGESLPTQYGNQDVDENEADDEALCRKMMTLVMSRPATSSALLPALEGLSILSTHPQIRQLLTNSPNFLTSLLSLAPTVQARGGSLPVTPRGSMDVDEKVFEPVETGVCYGVTTILVNLTNRKPTMSAEDQQIAKLRAMAISGKKGAEPKEEDPFEQDEAVKERVKKVLQAGCTSALRGLARAESRLVQEGLGRLCCNLVEDAADRRAFVRDGGYRVLSGIVRDLASSPSTRPNGSKADIDNTTLLPAAQALAKLVISIPPHLLFPPPHLTTSLNALTPLYTLLTHASSTLLQQFESLMALTNLASIDPSIAARIADASVQSPKNDSMWQSSSQDDNVKVMTKVEELMLDDNTMIRRAATELVCNLASSSAGFDYITGESSKGSSARAKSRLNVLLVLTDVDDLPTRLAAGGALAVLTESKSACEVLLSGDEDEAAKSKRSVWIRVLRMFEPEDAVRDFEEDEEEIPVISSTPANPDLIHRAVIILFNLITCTSTLEEARRQSEFRTARKAEIEEKLLGVLRAGGGEEVLQPTVECLKLLKRYPTAT